MDIFNRTALYGNNKLLNEPSIINRIKSLATVMVVHSVIMEKSIVQQGSTTLYSGFTYIIIDAISTPIL